MGQELCTVMVPPARSLAETVLIRSGLSTRQFCRFAHSSTANTPFTSVAVVSTGRAPQTLPMARARSLAPPRCPDKMGIAYRAHSSTTTTAGSVVLLFRWGAMARTAIPAAPT